MTRKAFNKLKAGLEEAINIARTVYTCASCDRPLTMAEFIERHCSSCSRDVDVVATKERGVSV